jgi:hypothetical protein
MKDDRLFNLSKESKQKAIKAVIDSLGNKYQERLYSFYERLSIAMLGCPEEEIMYAFYYAGLIAGILTSRSDPDTTNDIIKETFAAGAIKDFQEKGKK